MAVQKNLGFLLAGVWFILTGLIGILQLSFSGLPIVMGILALAAGICLIINR
jgi:hypothetical protein